MIFQEGLDQFVVLGRGFAKNGLLRSKVKSARQSYERSVVMLARVKERVESYDVQRLQRAARDYGSVRTRKFFEALKANRAPHAG